MEFDKETLQPLYRLTIGEAGESYALQIAKKLGIQDNVIKRSWEIVEAQQQRLQKGSGEAWGSFFSKDGEQEYAALPVEEYGNAEEKAAPSDRSKEKLIQFEIGDAVVVTSLGRTGIVYEKRDHLGMVGVMIQKQKMKINHKRLKPYLSKEELYPEEYDFDIIFESKDTRKKRKLMQRKHVEGLTITHRDEE